VLPIENLTPPQYWDLSMVQASVRAWDNAGTEQAQAAALEKLAVLIERIARGPTENVVQITEGVVRRKRSS
jgi:hypothetical protein